VRVWDNGPLHEDDLKARSNHPIDAVQLIAGEQWNTGVVLQGGQIVTVRFVKAIPPPS
jgi:2-keto-4-pentenoate hydratase